MNLDPIPEHGQTGGAPTSQVVAEVCAATLNLYKHTGFTPPWVGYLASENGNYVGSCAFTGPPSRDEVEIAYYTFPAYEGTGIATRMIGELLKIARAQPKKVIVIAHTLREEGASTTLLRRHGFQWIGEISHPEDGPVWKWMLGE